MTDRYDFKALFKSYNGAIQRTCEEQLMNITSPKEYDALINSARISWENTLVEGNKPSWYFNQIAEKQQLQELFIKAVEICDEFIPVSLIDTIKRLKGNEIIENFAFGDSDMILQSTAIRTLAQLENGNYCEKLTEAIYATEEELIKEAARQALIDLKPSAADFLIDRLQNLQVIKEDDYHLMIALVDIDKEKRTNRVYTVLKDCFIKADDKSLAARCLVDYNDKRAVVFLRGYLIKNVNKAEELEQQEIREAIRKLGGREDDI
ncbi:MAG: hypothetical protein JXQ23_05870 [Clostridia bacterium]|nr:hypothetical protein [Clostridia bacterium]